jgi:hypothetical protein
MLRLPRIYEIDFCDELQDNFPGRRCRTTRQDHAAVVACKDAWDELDTPMTECKPTPSDVRRRVPKNYKRTRQARLLSIFERMSIKTY